MGVGAQGGCNAGVFCWVVRMKCESISTAMSLMHKECMTLSLLVRELLAISLFLSNRLYNRVLWRTCEEKTHTRTCSRAHTHTDVHTHAHLRSVHVRPLTNQADAR